MTKTVVVRYQTNAEAADENQQLVENVFAELHRDRPDGVRYSAYRLADGVSFLHVATTGDDGSPLTGLAAFGEFQRGIGDRVTAPPQASEARMLGSYDGRGAAVKLGVAFVEAFGNGDRAALAGMVADDVVFESPRTRITGADDVVAAIAEFAGAVTGVTIVDAYGDDERALISYDMVTGPFGTLRAVDQIRAAHGKIVADTVVFDTHALLR